MCASRSTLLLLLLLLLLRLEAPTDYPHSKKTLPALPRLPSIVEYW
jgi:hypothetical protein